MAILRNEFADILAPGFREIYLSSLAFGERPPQMESIFNILTSTRQYEEDSYIGGLGLVPTKSEGAGVIYDAITQGFDQRYTHETRALGYRITKEMLEDELYGIMGQLPASLGKSMRTTVEVDAANVYNRAFSGSYLDGADGLELCSLLHVLTDGTTQKNELTNAADLNAASLEQALIDIQDTTDDRGLPLNLMPRKLVIPKNLKWTAKKLLESIGDFESANRTMNPAGEEGLQIVVNQYLTDTKAWFLLADVHKVNWFWRVRPDQMEGNDFDTQDMKVQTRARWSRSWTAPWGVFGSPGA